MRPEPKRLAHSIVTSGQYVTRCSAGTEIVGRGTSATCQGSSEARRAEAESASLPGIEVSRGAAYAGIADVRVPEFDH